MKVLQFSVNFKMGYAYAIVARIYFGMTWQWKSWSNNITPYLPDLLLSCLCKKKMKNVDAMTPKGDKQKKSFLFASDIPFPYLTF